MILVFLWLMLAQAGSLPNATTNALHLAQEAHQNGGSLRVVLSLTPPVDPLAWAMVAYVLMINVERLKPIYGTNSAIIELNEREILRLPEVPNLESAIANPSQF